MLEKKIEALGTYFDGMFRLPEGYNGVRVVIPDNWKVYNKKTDDYTITPQAIIDNNTRKMMFVGSPSAKVGDIMDFVYQVILNNIENEKKKQLFQSRIKELGDIFDNNQLSMLETLVFKFEKIKKSKKEMTAIIEDKNESITVDDKNSTENIIDISDIRKLANSVD